MLLQRFAKYPETPSATSAAVLEAQVADDDDDDDAQKTLENGYGGFGTERAILIGVEGARGVLKEPWTHDEL